MGIVVMLIIFGVLSLLIESPSIVGIEIEGGGRIGTSQIQALIGFQVGEPINDARVEESVNSILGLNEVKHVSISKRFQFPYSYHVQVDVLEREPFAVIEISADGTRWIDQDGHLLNRASDNINIPILKDVELDEDSTGTQVVSAELLSVLWEVFAMPGHVISQFSEIYVNEYDLDLISSDGRRIRLPSSGLRGHLAKLEKILELLEQEKITSWSVLDLRFAGEMTLR